MRILMFYHSLVSDWNHGNAHFLRGVATELRTRGHKVEIYEPRGAWSVSNLISEHGLAPIRKFHAAYPGLRSRRYMLRDFELESTLEGADLVLVHEWNDPELVRRIGAHRRRGGGYKLLFHDTHHRMVTEPSSMARYALEHYDGVLAYGNVLREMYCAAGRVPNAWTWHEAADTRVFHPSRCSHKDGDLVWIGNWGDDERSAELQEFLISPCQKLSLKARVHGVRYPEEARHSLQQAGIEYAGWLPNFEVPAVFAEFKLTLHVPRRPYVRALPGIPTIRPFEALACGIPLICSPWQDTEQLFRPGQDYLAVRDGTEMTAALESVLGDEKLARTLASNGLATIRGRHTCAHRVNELLAIHSSLCGTRQDDPAASTKENKVPLPA